MLSNFKNKKNSSSLSTIKKSFQLRKETLGPTVEALGWTTQEGQYARFNVFTQMARLSGHSILDVGCGFADFLKFLNERKWTGDYSGIDLTPEMIDECNLRFPNASFYCDDFIKQYTTMKKMYDYTVCSGVISHKVPYQWLFFDRLVEGLFKVSKKGFAFNALSSFAPPHMMHKKSYHYYDPKAVEKRLKKITSNFRFKMNYLPHDFTVFVYK
ncbi:class I SAM-dependent methyltransferase [bacterium]|nr:class I SAM-dependent methyltransferase [bacterium]